MWLLDGFILKISKFMPFPLPLYDEGKDGVGLPKTGASFYCGAF